MTVIVKAVKALHEARSGQLPDLSSTWIRQLNGPRVRPARCPARRKESSQWFNERSTKARFARAFPNICNLTYHKDIKARFVY
jgi:hypothetical protein